MARTVWVEVCMSEWLFDGSQQAGRVHDVYELRRISRDPVGRDGKHWGCDVRGFIHLTLSNPRVNKQPPACWVKTGDPAQFSAEKSAQESGHVGAEAESDDVDVLSFCAACDCRRQKLRGAAGDVVSAALIGLSKWRKIKQTSLQP